MDESYAPSTTDFGPIVNKIISSNADAFMGGGHYSDGATLARQMYDQKANMKWVSILVAPADDKFGELGPAAMGVTVPSQWEAQVSYKPQFGPTTAEFAKAFQDKFNARADYHAASGYTDGVILQHAIEQAGSIDPEKVTAALNATDVTTFFGHVKFSTDPGHHGLQVAHEMVLAQWQKVNGKPGRQVVWPTAAKSADLIYPHLGQPVTAGRRGRRRIAAGPDRLRPPMLGILASIIDGVLVGLVYGLAAMGLTLIWGVMDVINLTHGAMIVAGMLALYLLANALGMSPYLTLPPVLIGGFFVGVALYWIAIHRMVGRPPLMSLLSTFAVNLILIGVGTAVWGTALFNVEVVAARRHHRPLHLSRPAYSRRRAGGGDRRVCFTSFCTTPASARRCARSPIIARRPNSSAFRRRGCSPSRSASASRSPAYPAC